MTQDDNLPDLDMEILKTYSPEASAKATRQSNRKGSIESELPAASADSDSAQRPTIENQPLNTEKQLSIVQDSLPVQLEKVSLQRRGFIDGGLSAPGSETPSPKSVSPRTRNLRRMISPRKNIENFQSVDATKPHSYFRNSNQSSYEEGRHQPAHNADTSMTAHTGGQQQRQTGIMSSCDPSNPRETPSDPEPGPRRAINTSFGSDMILQTKECPSTPKDSAARPVTHSSLEMIGDDTAHPRKRHQSAAFTVCRETLRSIQAVESELRSLPYTADVLKNQEGIDVLSGHASTAGRANQKRGGTVLPLGSDVTPSQLAATSQREDRSQTVVNLRPQVWDETRRRETSENFSPVTSKDSMMEDTDAGRHADNPRPSEKLDSTTTPSRIQIESPIPSQSNPPLMSSARFWILKSRIPLTAWSLWVEANLSQESLTSIFNAVAERSELPFSSSLDVKLQSSDQEWSFPIFQQREDHYEGMKQMMLKTAGVCSRDGGHATELDIYLSPTHTAYGSLSRMTNTGMPY